MPRPFSLRYSLQVVATPTESSRQQQQVDAGQQHTDSRNADSQDAASGRRQRAGSDPRARSVPVEARWRREDRWPRKHQVAADRWLRKHDVRRRPRWSRWSRRPRWSRRSGRRRGRRGLATRWRGRRWYRSLAPRVCRVGLPDAFVAVALVTLIRVGPVRALSRRELVVRVADTTRAGSAGRSSRSLAVA